MGSAYMGMGRAYMYGYICERCSMHVSVCRKRSGHKRAAISQNHDELNVDSSACLLVEHVTNVTNVLSPSQIHHQHFMSKI